MRFLTIVWSLTLLAITYPGQAEAADLGEELYHGLKCGISIEAATELLKSGPNVQVGPLSESRAKGMSKEIKSELDVSGLKSSLSVFFGKSGKLARVLILFEDLKRAHNEEDGRRAASAFSKMRGKLLAKLGKASTDEFPTGGLKTVWTTETLQIWLITPPGGPLVILNHVCEEKK